MPRFWLSFEKIIECTVEAESSEALATAAAILAADGYELEHDWVSDGWDFSIHEIPRGEASRMPRVDCGIIGDEILAWSDYQQRRLDENSLESVDPRQESLPGVKIDDK